MSFNLCASGANTMVMPHGHCTHSTCMWNSPCMHPKHAIHMSQTCLTQAARALHTCHSHAIHRQHTFHMHTFMNAQAYCTVLHARMPQAQCTYSVCINDVCMVHTRNTQAAHMPHSPASHMPHMSHTQVCCRHAKDTHCVHIACKPHAKHACLHFTLILHMLHAHYCHAHSTYLLYSACMHTIPTNAGYLLLHVYLMQNTCKHFHEWTN
jgi:hypothetical protein